MGVHVNGVQRVLQTLSQMKVQDAIRIQDGLKKCAEVLYRKSQQLVPVDTGALKASGRVESSGRGFGARSAVIYDNPYAVFVHENLGMYHTPPTRARYVAAAVPMVMGTMISILKRQMKVTAS